MFRFTKFYLKSQEFKNAQIVLKTAHFSAFQYVLILLFDWLDSSCGHTQNIERSSRLWENQVPETSFSKIQQFHPPDFSRYISALEKFCKKWNHQALTIVDSVERERERERRRKLLFTSKYSKLPAITLFSSKIDLKI